MEIRDFYDGQAFDTYQYFGAHRAKRGFYFRTYAPNAERVCLIGDFNDWNEEEMERDVNGVYALQQKDACIGQLYKYRIYSQTGEAVNHCDPYGYGMELRPKSASCIVDLSDFRFTDDTWMEQRSKNHRKPLNIYELHFGSWRRNDTENGWYQYDELAKPLIAYLKQCRYTHVELMPLSEHPSDESWGYQNTGFFSPSSRYGSARALKRFINTCHRAGIGVIIDFVPVHFALDDYGLALYDGTALYEYPTEDIGMSEWGTLNFNSSKGEVASFLQSAANYWLTEYHFDGIRMDAISRAIYWQGDPDRGVNSTAVSFIKKMNQGLQLRHPTAMLFAEDSTSFPQVTVPVQYDGLGFDYKWDLGWMNDTLQYFQTPPAERPLHYHKLSFSMQYFYNELYILPLSHDEVVHGKATILQKMWGDYEQKFPQCRALYMYMYTHPGKKLNFMGNELGQFREWDEKQELDWNLLEYPLHDGFHHYLSALSQLYLGHPALYAEEYNRDCFRWLEINAPEHSVYAYQRSGNGECIVTVFNFSDEALPEYELQLPWPAQLRELLNSDHERWGGGTSKRRISVKTKQRKEQNIIKLDLPAFSGRMFLCEYL